MTSMLSMSSGLMSFRREFPPVRLTLRTSPLTRMPSIYISGELPSPMLDAPRIRIGAPSLPTLPPCGLV
jgi:hypothetical protein